MRLATLLLSFVATEAHAQADEAWPRFEVSGGGELVLEHTRVVAEVQAGLAVVDVTQSFHNPFDTPIAATYLFPLPSDAAVRSMSMTCGDRTIEGEILERAAAQAAYDQAAAEGRKAALLEQHKPNLFQQSVASLCPGEDVEVTLQYVDPLVQEDGHYELVFPTTVGPLYQPGETPEPPFTTIPSRYIDLEVLVAEGLPVESLWSDTHEIEAATEPDGATVVRNLVGDDLPNKDFHLAWTLGGSEPRVAAIALPPTADEDGYVALTLEPQVLEDLVEPQPRELIFVIDESCSMSGAPFETATATVRKALAGMRDDDRFNLVSFSSESTSLFPEPQPVNASTRARAEAWLGTFDGGGTEMTRGLVHALDMPGDPERLRLVLLLTDGYIGNDDFVLRTVERHLGQSRLFSLGVGSAVNRFLLDSLADVGRGDASYQLPNTPTDELVDTFYDRIAHPALTDLEIDWGGLDVREVYPSRIPDLFAGQPVRVVARWRGDADQDVTITVHGESSTESLSFRRPLSLQDAEAHEAVPTVWARRKIADLTRTLRDQPEALEKQGLAVALDHHLVSPWTSLVATEREPSACGPAGATVDVPSLLPEGLDPALQGGVGGLIGFGGTGLGGGGGYGGGMASLGGLGTMGMGSGASGYGTGGGSFGAKGEGGIGTVGGDPIILGALDKSLIDDVVKRHLNQIRYCYQRELTKDPGLAGKLVVKFTIAADGTVAAASVKSTTLNNEAVESCVTGRFMRMQFPAPAGGGIVIVSYPFGFAPG